MAGHTNISYISSNIPVDVPNPVQEGPDEYFPMDLDDQPLDNDEGVIDPPTKLGEPVSIKEIPGITVLPIQVVKRYQNLVGNVLHIQSH